MIHHYSIERVAARERKGITQREGGRDERDFDFDMDSVANLSSHYQYCKNRIVDTHIRATFSDREDKRKEERRCWSR